MSNGSFYLFTLPMNYNRADLVWNKIYSMMPPDDLIFAALRSAIEYVGNYRPPYYDEGHWHRLKTDTYMQEQIDNYAMELYEESRTEVDETVSMQEITDHIGDWLWCPYNAIRNHLIHAVIRLNHTPLVNSLYEYTISINWLSPHEFVVVLDPSDSNLQHHPLFKNVGPGYV